MKTLNLYRASFTGRECGAIGITYKVHCNVIANNEEEAQQNLYTKYEHLSNVSLTLNYDFKIHASGFIGGYYLAVAYNGGFINKGLLDNAISPVETPLPRELQYELKTLLPYEKQTDKFRDQFLTKYYVYKHDSKTEIDHVSNYAISDDSQSFRFVPCDALIGTEEVYATSKDNALMIAKFKLKQRGLI